MRAKFAAVFFPETRQYAVVAKNQVNGECRVGAVVFVDYERPYKADVVGVDTSRARLDHLITQLLADRVSLVPEGKPNNKPTNRPNNGKRRATLPPKTTGDMPTPGERVIAEFVTTTIELLENNEQQQRVPLRRRSDAHSMAVPKRLRFSNDDKDDNVTKIDETQWTNALAMAMKKFENGEISNASSDASCLQQYPMLPVLTPPDSETGATNAELLKAVIALRQELVECRTEIAELKTRLQGTP